MLHATSPTYMAAKLKSFTVMIAAVSAFLQAVQKDNNSILHSRICTESISHRAGTGHRLKYIETGKMSVPNVCIHCSTVSGIGYCYMPLPVPTNTHYLQLEFMQVIHPEHTFQIFYRTYRQPTDMKKWNWKWSWGKPVMVHRGKISTNVHGWRMHSKECHLVIITTKG